MAKAFPLLAIDPSGTVGDNFPLMLHIRLGEMLQFARHIDDPRNISELHDMRIAAKRLRYTMELFLPYLDGADGRALAGLLDKTKRIQEMIGEIHDRDVRVPAAREFLHRHERRRPEIRSGLVALVEKETAERQRIYTEVVAYWSEQREKYISRLLALIASVAQHSISPAAESNSPVAKALTESKSDAHRGDQ